MNKIILIGRLVRDPELKFTQSGKAVCNFTIAVNKPFTQNGENEADFINCQVWGKVAENVAKYITKGRQVGVEGRLQIRSYEANDGTKKYVTEVVCSSVEFLGNSSGNSGSGYNNKENKNNDLNPDFGDPIAFSDEDLPF